MKNLLFFGACCMSLTLQVRSQIPYTWNTIEGIPEVFFQPYGLAADTAGNIFVADTLSETVRQLTPAGNGWVLSTLAGSVNGFADGTNADAQFNYPAAVAVGPAGTLYVADFFNHAIRKLAPIGTDWAVTTIAGNGSPGTNDDIGTNARFNHPTGVAADAAGNLYVADSGNDTIRKISFTGGNWVVRTQAGAAGLSGTTDGTNATARFASPWGITVDNAGNLYVTDFGSSRLRKVRPSGNNWVVSTIAGLAPGFANGTNGVAQFNYPMGITVDGSGILYVADFYNEAIRSVAPLGTNWVVSTIGGEPGVSGSSDGTGPDAHFSLPRGIAVGTQGRLFVADTGNSIIRVGKAALILQIAVSGNELVLTCPSAATNFVLETRPTLLPAAWTPVTSGVTVSGSNFILQNNRASAAGFFRLRQLP
jgi:streptogramin lyase